MELKTTKSGGLSIQPTVFWISAVLITGFVLWGVLASGSLSEVSGKILGNVSAQLGWFFITAANIFLIYTVYLFFSKFGSIRLGGKNATPEFSTTAWFAMLFSAGMGIGLVFWSVGEPMWHFIGPPSLFGVEGSSGASAQAAMAVTIFHWGFHAWAIYAVIGLALAFFCFNKGLPLTPRSAFYPLIGDKIYGFWGHLIDIIAVFATIFGLATSLGLGAQQVNAGLTTLFGVAAANVGVQVILIAIITGIAIISVVTGLKKGVKILSQFNIYLALLLTLFVLILGPTLFLFDSLGQNIGSYLSNIIPLSTWTESYGPVEAGWQHSWTVFYWAWWIAWSPFVGMFIARISKGRTIRQFVGGVLFVPTLVSSIWLTVFGGTALHRELYSGGGIVDAVKDNVATAMFELLATLPLAEITSFLMVIVIITFFVTSSDSGSLVVDTITSGGNLHPPVIQKVFWASAEGVVAAVLLLAGGLGALQSSSIAAGFPFAIILLLMVVSLHKGLSKKRWLWTKTLISFSQSFKRKGRLLWIERPAFFYCIEK